MIRIQPFSSRASPSHLFTTAQMRYISLAFILSGRGPDRAQASVLGIVLKPRPGTTYCGLACLRPLLRRYNLLVLSRRKLRTFMLCILDTHDHVRIELNVAQAFAAWVAVHWLPTSHKRPCRHSGSIVPLVPIESVDWLLSTSDIVSCLSSLLILI